jgi:hypothetical protein
MTVKELIEVLQTCNDDATIIIKDDNGSGSGIYDEQIWATSDGLSVIIDPSYRENE